MNRKQKEKVVEDLSQIFSNSGVVLVAHYTGLTVSEISELRNLMRESDCGVRVAKNRLSKIALEGKANAKISEFLNGQTVLLFSEDPVAAAKISVKFSKSNENLKLIGGSLGEEILDLDGIINLSKLPSREELVSEIVGLIGSSGSTLAQLVGSPGSNIAGITAAIEEKKAA
ncbi:MAG: 50S ribosomal protein L10 [Paracoccaceae bacterium]